MVCVVSLSDIKCLFHTHLSITLDNVLATPYDKGK